MRKAVLIACAIVAFAAFAGSAVAGGGNSTNAQRCYKGGWQTLYRSDGSTFASQDACVSYAAHDGTLVTSAPIVGMAVTPDAGGYWLVNAAGAISLHGDASSHGSLAGASLSSPIVGMARTPDGGGYWLVNAAGGVFGFGDATFYGPLGGGPLTYPIVDMAPTADGGGYWLVDAAGDIYPIGDATPLG